MSNIPVNSNINNNNVRPDVATNNDALANGVDANQQNIGVANENNPPSNHQNIGDRPLEQREAMQQEQVPAVDIDALIQRYQGLIKCESIGDGKYGLTLSGEGISNEMTQEILEAFKDVNISKLTVISCGQLKALPIQNLTNLESLCVISCGQLKALPIENLTNLTSLRVSNCPIAGLPIQNLTNLESLCVISCGQLKALPIQGLRKLTRLEVCGCSKLTALPIQRLTNLTSLEVFSCSELTALPIENLTNLKSLKVSYCPIAGLPIQRLTNLESLYVSNCGELTALPIEDLTNLKRLEVCGCSKLTALPIQRLTNLTSLEVFSCSELTALPIENLTNLKSLKVWGCNILTALPIEDLRNLESLEVNNCPSLHGELDVSGSLQLKSVYIDECADDFVVVISPECPLAQGLPANYPYVRIKGQLSIEEQCTSFLSNDEDKGVVQSVIDLVRNHNQASNGQRKDCLDFLKSYCERYANASEEEKAIAAEKYISALKDFKLYLDACRDAFATGLAKLKIELELAELLNKCKTLEELQQVLQALENINKCKSNN